MSDVVVAYDFDPTQSARGFPLAEDEAMKRKLSGLKIKDMGGRVSNVGVWFSMPSPERRQDYPFITINQLAMLEATDQTHSEYNERSIDRAHVRPGGPASADVWPSLTQNVRTDTNTAAGVAITWSRYRPVYLIYQVTTHCRNYIHSVQLFSRFLQADMFPLKWGFLDIAEDATRRQLDNLGYRRFDSIDAESPGQDKRVFRNVFTLRTTGWIPEFPATVVPIVTEVDVAIHPDL